MMTIHSSVCETSNTRLNNSSIIDDNKAINYMIYRHLRSARHPVPFPGSLRMDSGRWQSSDKEQECECQTERQLDERIHTRPHSGSIW